jgi:hypothetical protein
VLSPTVFLTASHSLVGNEEFGLTNVRVTFDEIIDADLDGRVDAGATAHSGTSHPHPLLTTVGYGIARADKTKGPHSPFDVDTDSARAFLDDFIADS